MFDWQIVKKKDIFKQYLQGCDVKNSEVQSLLARYISASKHIDELPENEDIDDWEFSEDDE